MDGMTRADLQGVVAPLNFLAPMAEKPFSYNYEPPPGMPARNGQMIEHQVTVRDARPVIERCRSTARASSCCATRPRRPISTTRRSSARSITPNASG